MRRRFMTSSSVVACSSILFGYSGVIPEKPLLQSYDTAYTSIVPAALNEAEVTEPPRLSMSTQWRRHGELRRKVHLDPLAYVLFSLVFESRSQVDITPSDPHDNNEPCFGWKTRSFTENTSWELRAGAGSSLRWHLKLKFFLPSGSLSENEVV